MNFKFGMLLLAVLVLLPLNISLAQDSQPAPPPPPCSQPEYSQFDFWIGEWNLTWGDSARGTNTITKDYNNCVIIENFDGHPGINFTGMSISTYNSYAKNWNQLWVDDQGGYLDFVGAFQDGKMYMSRTFEDKDGNLIIQRMVWHNIEENSLDWNWERSIDSGSTWETRWSIHYERKK
jgi:hypothetical protein